MGCIFARCKNTVKRSLADLMCSVLGGAAEMQRCYNVSNFLSALISTQRKKKKQREELGQRDDVGGTPNDRYDRMYSGESIQYLKNRFLL